MKEDIRNIEIEKKTLELNLLEIKKTHQNSVDENLILIKNLKQTDIIETREKQQVKEMKSGDFIKTINQEK